MFCRHRGARRTSAFTLVELLVVIAIIGILVALLLPAIQAAREAARRAQCQSHMKNISLAVLNFESAKKKLPMGFVSSPSQTESWGWAVFSLPYLEEQPLYDRLKPSETFISPVNGARTGNRNLADVLTAARTIATERQALETVIPVFRCPSDGTPGLVPCIQASGGCGIINPPTRTQDTELFERSFRGVGAPVDFLPPVANYVGSRGIIDAGCPVGNQAICNSNGVFFGNSQVTLQQISDGTTKTFMIGERDKFCLAGTWLGARNPADGAEIHSSLWTLAHVAIALNHPETAHYETCPEGFSSAHPGGGFFAFCDGSVRFVSEDVSFDMALNSKTCLASKTDPLRCKPQIGTRQIGVYQRLAWRDDEMTIDDSSF